MNLYEHTIIARQDTSPSELKQLTEKYSKISLEIENFSVSSACLNNFLTISNLSYSSFPIPTIWEP